MSKLSAKIKEEFLEILPPTIFFFVALHIVAFIRVLMLEGTGIAPTTSVSVTIAALILGKAVVIADMLPFINRFPEKPLLHNVAWKTAIYLAVAAIVALSGAPLRFLAARRVASSPATRSCWRRSSGRISGPSRSFCCVLILMYCTMHELARVIGEGEDETDVLRAAADPAGLSANDQRAQAARKHRAPATVRRAQAAVMKASRNRYVEYVRTRIGGGKERKA